MAVPLVFYPGEIFDISLLLLGMRKWYSLLSTPLNTVCDSTGSLGNIQEMKRRNKICSS